MELVEDRPGIIVLRVSGKNAAKLFQHESGGHRFQRVPPTEKRGRVQTSTVTVATLGVPSDNDLVIADKDLRWSFCRSGGSGGQHVNKTESAVQLLHVPTGVQIRCESERSQTQNKITALAVLRARIWEAQQEKAAKGRAQDRKQQVGSGMRADKTVTIALQRDQVTHHVTGKTMSATRYLKGFLNELN